MNDDKALGFPPWLLETEELVEQAGDEMTLMGREIIAGVTATRLAAEDSTEKIHENKKHSENTNLRMYALIKSADHALEEVQV